jgi:hypothetical protein
MVGRHTPILVETAAREALRGGTPAGADRWPSVVAVDRICSGALVHPEIVLYAGHCGTDIREVTFGSAVDAPDARSVPVVECRANPDGGLGTGADIAFCQLARPVDDVPIVPLLAPDASAELLVVGLPVTLVGFGESEQGGFGVKRELETSVRAVGRELAIGGDGRGTCPGDSGGPAFAQLLDGGWRLAAVTSSSTSPTCDGVTTFFSPVAPSVAWLEQASGRRLIPETPAGDAGCVVAGGATPSARTPLLLGAAVLALAARRPPARGSRRRRQR